MAESKLYIVAFVFIVFVTLCRCKCVVELPPFTCERTKSDHIATAQTLHPSDVQLVAAMGDSITSGLFMRFWKNPISIRLEHRSFGYSNGVKIDSIYKNIDRYGQDVEGAAKSATHVYSFEEGYNFAITAAGVNMLAVEVQNFIKKMKSETKRQASFWYRLFHRDQKEFESPEVKWKLINIWIGAIDLCSNQTSGYFEENLRASLELLRVQSNHTFVNLVMHPNITQVYDVTKNTKWCSTIQGIMKMCPPLFKKELSQERQFMDRLRLEYNEVIKTIASDYAQRQDPEFMVAAQGGLLATDMNPYKTHQVLSLFDCFHPNVCSNKHFALRLWNSMFTPVDQDINVSNSTWYCPTSKDFIQ